MKIETMSFKFEIYLYLSGLYQKPVFVNRLVSFLTNPPTGGQV